MNRVAWIIIFSVILASAAIVIAVVVAAYKRPYMPADLGQSPQNKPPEKTVVTAERIVRLEVQLKSSNRETRLGAMCELAEMAEGWGVSVSQVVLETIADRMGDRTGSYGDVLQSILSRSLLTGQRIDVDLAQDVLDEYLNG